MEDGRLQTFKRIPAALKTLDVRLEKNSENAALWLLDKCFDGKNISKQSDPHLTLAIQNLMGNVQVNAPGNAVPADRASNEPATTTNGVLSESSSTSTTPETVK